MKTCKLQRTYFYLWFVFPIKIINSCIGFNSKKIEREMFYLKFNIFLEMHQQKKSVFNLN